ncbi:MAG: hypothetical protein AUJ23_00645 [Candidatus Magasanikbacteria bacterium CG1_02_32_51]|uniref:Cysteinyl-tRNA ligase anticodon binding domain-containing protein n=1 Tax=Candidatus Magasanikbacteria bacterium CG1_02_32_51 TaxID=1805238 RepID=A0A1J4UCP9_9BACT|nr:MAG: hypothetical protein AUJ23_00645 [Candidatus Magasanikbacteria bacterium CG1_02_32_51]
MNKIKEKNISPIAYRFFLLQTHYRKQLNFSWEALEAAQNGLKKLQNKVLKLKNENEKIETKKIQADFLKIINDDLNMPEALALIWEAFKDQTIDYNTIIKFDTVLGLDLDQVQEKNIKIPTEVLSLLDQRKTAREKENWSESDRLRDEIKALGFVIKDTSEGQKIF